MNLTDFHLVPGVIFPGITFSAGSVHSLIVLGDFAAVGACQLILIWNLKIEPLGGLRSGYGCPQLPGDLSEFRGMAGVFHAIDFGGECMRHFVQ